MTRHETPPRGEAEGNSTQSTDPTEQSTSGAATALAGRQATADATGPGRTADTSRRSFLKTVGAGALAGTALSAGGTAVAASGEFVDTQGTNFVLDGDPLYFNGTNNFWLADPYTDRSQVDQLFQLFDDMGLDLVRTWAFCEGDGGHCIQPEPGVHNEAGLRYLDYIVATAKQHGIRLNLCFVDFWEAYGGMSKYVEWAGGGDRGLFYVNDQCREWYKNHVETIVTRTNSITGVPYNQEPAIAMWELANEPRLQPKYTSTISDRAGTLEGWISDMSSFIKDLDGNHLISSGTEGFYTRSDGQNWMYNSNTAQDFVSIHSIDTIDVCSFHMYPHWWPGLDLEGHMGSDDFVTGVEWIREHVRDAHQQVGKPAYLGEFNVNRQEHSLSTRNDRLQAWYDTLDAENADAATIWQFVLESTNDHDGFQVYRSESGDIIDGYTNAVQAKSGSSGAPVVDAVGPTRVRRGETANFSGVYSFDPEGGSTTYGWTFGDGSSATGVDAGHRYDATGTYDVELSVSDDQGNVGTDAETVTVDGIPSNSYLLEGAGETLHRDTKEFHLATMPISGDFTVTAKVATMDPIAPGAQAGIIVVDDPTAPGALGAATTTPGEGSEMTRAYDSTTWRERASDGRAPPIWLRLARSGGTVTASVSPDGSSWTQINSGQVDMPTDAHVGLFVSSNSPGDLCTVQFDGVDWLENPTSRDVGPVEVPGNTTAGQGGSVTTPTDTPIATPTDTPTETATPTDTPTESCPAPEAPAWSDGTVARDVDDDGVYEDLNGNCEFDSDDVVTYFQEIDRSGIQENPGYYDANGNGNADFDDIVTLFQQL